MIIATGVPVVSPSNTPETIRTSSGSRRWVVKRDVPGRRKSSHFCTSGSDRGTRGGTPSTTQPIDGPWLSPQVVKRNSRPKLFPSMPLLLEVGEEGCGIPHAARVHHAHDMIAGIHMQHFAGDAAAQIAEQIQGGTAHLVDRGVAFQRRVIFVPLQDVAEVADSRGGQRLDRPRRYGVDEIGRASG